MMRTAALMQRVGLSMSLGAFLAGVLMAESEYRHELQADIEPFEGLLLGLFFLSVGMGANLGLIADIPLHLVAVTASMILTPLVFAATQRFVVTRFQRSTEVRFDEIDEPHHPIIIAGFGRFGQIVARVLRMRHVSFTALEVNGDARLF